MSKLETTLTAISIVSVILNIGLIVYAKAAISRLVLVSEELGDLQDMINSFLNHIKQVYEMDMFYGDQTLQGLLEHAREFSVQMESFEYIYSLTDEDEVEEQAEIQEEQI
mgnify:CR=1 FL=1|tara:strand:+ start:274 stop:603 length:330 start_codon:yes stop_codon:yes gene_type:complete